MTTHPQNIVRMLKTQYPKATIALRYSTPWELLVAVILSAQCTDITVNNVTEKLFQKYPTFDAYLLANLQQFEQDIKPTGCYRTKAKHILQTAKRVETVYNGKVPQTMEEMLTLPGVARKTANIVLGIIYGVVSGIPVDTHVKRISQRLRLVDTDTIGGTQQLMFVKDGKKRFDYKKDASPAKIEQQLMQVVAKEDWLVFSYVCIEHGRAVCKAQQPRCTLCMFRERCVSSRIG